MVLSRVYPANQESRWGSPGRPPLLELLKGKTIDRAVNFDRVPRRYWTRRILFPKLQEEDREFATTGMKR